MLSPIKAGLIHSSVNSFISLLFVATFASGATLIIWRAAFNENPVANAFATAIEVQAKLSE